MKILGTAAGDAMKFIWSSREICLSEKNFHSHVKLFSPQGIFASEIATSLNRRDYQRTLKLNNALSNDLVGKDEGRMMPCFPFGGTKVLGKVRWSTRCSPMFILF